MLWVVMRRESGKVVWEERKGERKEGVCKVKKGNERKKNERWKIIMKKGK